LAFEDADGRREWTASWFGQEQVDVLGHEDVAVEKEMVTLAEAVQCFFKDSSGMIIVQQGETAVTTEGEEVMVAFGLVSLQTAGHEEWGLSGSEIW
jgi:hypothetical protein